MGSIGWFITSLDSWLEFLSFHVSTAKRKKDVRQSEGDKLPNIGIQIICNLKGDN